MVIAGSALIHATLLLLLFAAKAPTPMVSDVGAISVTLLDGRAVNPAAEAPTAKRDPAPSPPSAEKVEIKPIVLTDIQPQFLDVSLRQAEPDARPSVDDPVALAVAAAAASAEGGAPCNLARWLQSALQADPQVREALAQIPRPARSVANAIMLWDGAWVATDAKAATGIAAIRLALLSGIEAAPAACRDQPIRGPELFTLGDAAGTTVIVVGSGSWRWSDLLQADPLPTDQMALVAALAARP